MTGSSFPASAILITTLGDRQSITTKTNFNKWFQRWPFIPQSKKRYAPLTRSPFTKGISASGNKYKAIKMLHVLGRSSESIVQAICQVPKLV